MRATDHAEVRAVDVGAGPDYFSSLLGETPASHLRSVRQMAPRIRETLQQSGVVNGFASRSLVTLPYPRHYGLWEACSVPVPYVFMTNRMFVVRYQDFEGVDRILVAEPSDYELGAATPYLARSMERFGGGWKEALVFEKLFTRHGSVESQLLKLGVRLDQVDYICFDHLHTQDVRRLIGTTRPQQGLGEGKPIQPLFPHAKLLVQKDELSQVEDVHPFQARFHQSSRYADVDRSRLILLESSILLGRGVALLRTPGHTFGNQTLVVNTRSRGLFVSSENGIAVDCWAPERSRIPGLSRWTWESGMEVVMNFNAPEFASWQHNAMVLEKLIADSIPGAPGVPQCVPSSELTHHRLAPGIRPTWELGELTL
jgi:hypothetical protein